jgi:hypothetical protein
MPTPHPGRLRLPIQALHQGGRQRFQRGERQPRFSTSAPAVPMILPLSFSRSGHEVQRPCAQQRCTRFLGGRCAEGSAGSAPPRAGGGGGVEAGRACGCGDLPLKETGTSALLPRHALPHWHAWHASRLLTPRPPLSSSPHPPPQSSCSALSPSRPLLARAPAPPALGQRLPYLGVSGGSKTEEWLDCMGFCCPGGVGVVAVAAIASLLI